MLDTDDVPICVDMPTDQCNKVGINLIFHDSFFAIHAKENYIPVYLLPHLSIPPSLLFRFKDNLMWIYLSQATPTK